MLLGFLFVSCEKEDEVNFSSNKACIVSKCVEKIEYFKNGKMQSETYPFKKLNAEVKPNKNIPIFSEVDSVYIYSTDNKCVICKRNEKTSRNILDEHNYQEVKDNVLNGYRDWYFYYIDSAYFTDEKYINPCIDNIDLIGGFSFIEY